jgi:hypothetical protein
VLAVDLEVEDEAQQRREQLPALLESPDIDVMLDACKRLGSLIELFGHMKMSLDALMELSGVKSGPAA